MISLFLISLLLALVRSEFEFDVNEIPGEDLPAAEGVYLLALPGDNCLNTCFDAGHPSCITNLGGAGVDDAANALYDLWPEGEYSIWDAIWSEEYHPMLDSDGSFVGWEDVPAFGGSCTAFPPDFTQRRLCRCGLTPCEDTFHFCRALTWVCHKYSYTQRSCPMTCEMCHYTAMDDFFMP